ncbi:hydrolase [Desulfosarcina alkanivorans]|uniref:Hydrolase n=1 Tax=Desulfosarcina alkanivorans TaxID=571177 RepID=A0A5K7YYH6_9BACT|nr:linear amide C-N hydrolase [Desulfosarcina alkanivorans]BBO71374.1 hydrolase [Desulfosarcina alkanivorans]
MKIRLMRFAAVVLGGAILFMQPDAEACTTFQLTHEGQVFVGKNYDWMVEDGLIIVNKRGVSKTAFQAAVDNTGLGTPATWTSRYGSITFTQYGRELGPGGMNEAGLVVESMGLFRNTPNRKYPEPDDRDSVLAGQWRQYQLDNFATVKEVIESDAILRIRPQKGIHSHFIVSDRQGNCATIEFLDGEMDCHTGETLPYRALTNNTYALSLDCLKNDTIPEPDQFKSIERFIRAAKMVEDYHPGTSAAPVDYAFEILKSVSWRVDREWNGTPFTSNTRWSIVYDQKNRRINFRTHGNPRIRVIRLDAFDFSCKTPVKVLDATAALSGDVSDKFVDYTRQVNRDLIENAFTKTVFFPSYSATQLDVLADYPETFVCEH